LLRESVFGRGIYNSEAAMASLAKIGSRFAVDVLVAAIRTPHLTECARSIVYYALIRNKIKTLDYYSLELLSTVKQTYIAVGTSQYGDTGDSGYSGDTRKFNSYQYEKRDWHDIAGESLQEIKRRKELAKNRKIRRIE